MPVFKLCYGLPLGTFHSLPSAFVVFRARLTPQHNEAITDASDGGVALVAPSAFLSEIPLIILLSWKLKLFPGLVESDFSTSDGIAFSTK